MKRVLLIVTIMAWAAAGLISGGGCTPTAAKPAGTTAPKGGGPAAGPKPKANPTPAVLPRFTSVAETSGVVFTLFNDEVPGRFFLPEVMGGGAAWLDYDRDGRLDLYLANGCALHSPDEDPAKPVALAGRDKVHLNRLFRNVGGGQFEEVAVPAFATDDGYGQGLAVGDYDSDGFEDLYICNYGTNLLLHNNGDGTFSDVTDAAGVGDELWGTSTLWADLNNDGLLDLYVVNYLNVDWQTYRVCTFNDKPGYCGPGEYQGMPDRVYLNNGDGTFREAAKELGIVGKEGKGLAIVAVDLDGDLRPEVYVANDMAANFLYSRTRVPGAPEDAKRPYLDVADLTGSAFSDNGQNEASMGISCADFDGDHRPDLFLTHFFSHKNTLYRNEGNLMFKDDSRRSRAAATSYDTLGFGTVPIDYDLDGAFDLAIANGHVLGPQQEPYTMRPQLLWNDGTGRFYDISDDAGPYFKDKWLGRGAAGADYDDDGDIDLTITHLNRPVALLRNDTDRKNHFIGLSLETPNRIPPIGGRVVVQSGTGKWTRPIMSGGSYLSSSDPRLLFGVGASSKPVSVTVYWPSGKVQELGELDVDRYWRVMEGEPAVPSFTD